MHTIRGRIPGLGFRFIAEAYRADMPGLRFRVERYLPREIEFLLQIYDRVVWITVGGPYRRIVEETSEAEEAA